MVAKPPTMMSRVAKAKMRKTVFFSFLLTYKNQFAHFFFGISLHRFPFTCGANHWSMLFKEYCPIAYSYAYDDNTSTYVCKDTASYDIVFCPVKGSFKNRDHEVVQPTAVGQIWQPTPTSLTAEESACVGADRTNDGWPGFENDYNPAAVGTAAAAAAATPNPSATSINPATVPSSAVIASMYGSATTGSVQSYVPKTSAAAVTAAPTTSSIVPISTTLPSGPTPIATTAVAAEDVAAFAFA